MKKLLILLIIATAFSSCEKEEVSSDQLNPIVDLYQEYAVEYNSTSKKTEVNANINEKNKDGKFVKLQEPGKIVANSSKLDYFNSPIYLYTYSTKFKDFDSFNLELTKPTGVKIKNEIKKTDFSDIKFEQNDIRLSKKNGATIKWTATQDPLNENSEVYIRFLSFRRSKTLIAHTVKGLSKEITGKDLENHKVGDKILIEISRSKKMMLPNKDGSAGAEVTLYYIAQLDAEVVE